MADFNGVGRTNYVLVDNIDALRSALEPFSVRIAEKDGKFALFGNGEGGWPSQAYDRASGNELEFSVDSLVMPHVTEGEVLVVMEAGFENERYVSGWAKALVRRGSRVHETFLSIDQIYQRAATEFGVPNTAITKALF